MDDQDSGGMVEEKPCILSLSAAIKAYSSANRTEEYQPMKATEELEILQQRKLTGAIEFTASTILSKNSGEDDDFEDFYETQSYTLICRLCEKFHESIKSIMDQRMVGVAFEGQNIGRNGVLSLVQIATDSELIIFDMIRLRDGAFKAGLQSVFESQGIMKVIHDCRWIAGLLQFQHNISMANIFDTQVANAFVHRSLNGGKWPKYVEGLSDCLISYLNLPRHDIHCSQISEENEVIWLVRPLPLDLLDSATKNAVYLLKLQRVLLAEMLAEFKAAVELYLNLIYGAGEDFKMCQVTSHLLPAAFIYIHKYIQNKSGGCSTRDQQSHDDDFLALPAKQVTSNLDSDLHENQNLSGPQVSKIQHSLAQTLADKKRKSRPKRAKNNLWSSEKVKISCLGEKGASGNKTSVPLHLERENISTKMVESPTKYSQEKTGEIDCAVAVSPSGDNDDDAGSFLCNEDVVPGEDVSYPASPNRHVSQTVSLSDKNFSQREITASSGTLEVAAIEMESVLPPCGPPRQEKEGLKAEQLKQVEDLPASAADQLTDHLEQPIVIRINYPILPLHSYSQQQDLSKASVLHPPLTSAKLDVPQPSSQASKASSGGDHIINLLSSGPIERQETPTSKRTGISERSCVETLSGHLHIGYQRCTQEKANQFHVEESNVMNSVKESCPSASNGTHNNNIFAGQDIKSFQCRVCFKVFASREFLDLHAKVHQRPKRYMCDLCNRRYTSLSSLKQHFKSHSGVGISRCDICSKEYTDANQLKIHMRSHTGERPFSCDICEKSFAKSSHLYVHKRSHLKEKLYKCRWCGKELANKYSKQHHENFVCGDHQYKCNYCEKRFKSKTDLDSHQSNPCWNFKKYLKDMVRSAVSDSSFSKSSSEKSNLTLPETNIMKVTDKSNHFKCEVCEESFPSKVLLRSHKKTHPSSFSCDVCGKTFSSRFLLKNHQVLHTGDKPHMCDVCGKCFPQRCSLLSHLGSHSTERLHKCNICHKSFRNRSGLKRHERTHSEHRPYKCEVCCKSFTHHSYYSQHKRIHTGYKPYKCHLCDRTFGRSYHRTKHVKTVHSMEKQIKKYSSKSSLPKPLKCDVCDKSFKNRKYLNQHKRTHSEHRPYKCDLCDKSFKRNHHRLIHIRGVHAKVLPYQCEECEQCFVDEDNLTHHKKVHLRM